jgi:hypothetical protein
MRIDNPAGGIEQMHAVAAVVQDGVVPLDHHKAACRRDRTDGDGDRGAAAQELVVDLPAGEIDVGWAKVHELDPLTHTRRRRRVDLVDQQRGSILVQRHGFAKRTQHDDATGQEDREGMAKQGDLLGRTAQRIRSYACTARGGLEVTGGA